jgi:PTS system nitrogen regulatory IIA component
MVSLEGLDAARLLPLFPDQFIGRACLSKVTMTTLADLLSPKTVFPRARWQGRRQVLSEMSAAMATALGLDPKSVHEALLERERLGSTGVGEGVAIPHARLEGLSRPVGGFARLAEPADFEAIDERPCDLVFMLLAPKDAGAEHLKALARVSRLFRQEAVRAALRKEQTEEGVLAILCPDETSHAA